MVGDVRTAVKLAQCTAAAGAAFLLWKFLRRSVRHPQLQQLQKEQHPDKSTNQPPDRTPASGAVAETGVAARESKSLSGQEKSELRRILTVVITTSPAADNPRTHLIEQVVSSFSFVDGMLSCRIIIVCDGYKYVEGIAPSKINLRGGKVDDIRMENYEGYKRALREKAARGEGCWRCVEVLELPEHQGFGFAVKAGLQRVTTEFVCVVQHDRTFMRKLDFNHLLAGFDAHHDLVGYVLIPTSSTRNYAHSQRSRLGQLGWKDCDLDAASLDLGRGVRLLPCIQFYDSTHVCRTEYYRNYVFGCGGGGDLGGRGTLFKRGGYIEEIVNQEQRKMWTEGGREGDAGGRRGEGAQSHTQMRRFVREFRTWLYEDGQGRAVAHLNGRTYRHAHQEGKRGG